MFGSQILEVGVGLILVFLLVSLILTAVREAIESFAKTRSRDLELAIAELLNDRTGQGLRKELYEHPLVFSLFPGGVSPTVFTKAGKVRKRMARNTPSYIPREVFSAALQDILRKNGDETGHIGRAYKALLDAAAGDTERARKGIEQWYDASMDRASGWFKRRTQMILLVLGFLVAVALNINAIAIAQYLAVDETARTRMIAIADQVGGQGTAAPRDDDLARRLDREVRSVGLPIGWDGVQTGRIQREFEDNPLWALLSLLIGYMMVGFAATLGAPFWFDLLGKFMVVRSTVKPREKSPDEATKDGGTGGAPMPRPQAGGEAPDGGAAGN